MEPETSSQNQDLEAKENSSNQPLFREAPRRPLKEKVARLGGFIASVLAVSGGMVAFLAYFTSVSYTHLTLPTKA